MPRTRNTIHGTPGFICGGAFDFGFAALYLPIRCRGGYFSWLDILADVIRSRESFSLLLASIVLAACASDHGARPDLPASISPGWKLSSLDRSAAPSGILRDGSPECWKADYSGEGSAQVWVCRYSAEASAFEAVQRARAEAQTVKFQEGRYFVLVQWNNVPKVSLTALVRTIQKTLQPK